MGAGVPNKDFLYFIVDSMNRCARIISRNPDVVQYLSSPLPLPQHPKGWKDIQISFGTSFKYWSLNRAFTVPMFFINDGATICRDAIYSGRGYEDEKYLIIVKLNPDTGIYELEYRGRLDFSKYIDQPRKGITVNTIEGGPLSFITANDGVDYAIPLSALNEAAQLIEFDGVNLRDTYKYSMIEVAFTDAKTYALPFAFISNDGDSVGIIQGTQQFEIIGGFFNQGDVDAYIAASANYFYSSVSPVTLNIYGVIPYDILADVSVKQYLFIQTSLGNIYPIVGTAGAPVEYNSNQSVSINVALTINLAANEKAFLIGSSDVFFATGDKITFRPSFVYISFNSRNQPSSAYGLPIIDVLKQLTLLMTNGKYTADSVYFSANRNLCWTSTNALKNFAFNVYYGSFQMEVVGSENRIIIPGPLQALPTDNQLVISASTSGDGIYTILSVLPIVAGFTTIIVQEPVVNATLSGNISTIAELKTNFQDLFNDSNCLKNIGMKIVNDVIFWEPKDQLYNDEDQIFDIGEIADLKLHYAEELLCNTAHFGYRSQDYRQRNGVYEYNTTTLFKLPVNTIKRDLTNILKARGDCFGIEFIRSALFNTPTTDSTGDNQPFIINTQPGQPDVVATVSFISGGGVNPDVVVIPLGIAIVVGDQLQFSGSVSNNVTKTVSGVGILFVAQFIFLLPDGPALVNENDVSVLIHFVLSKYLVVKRLSYDNITGVLDNTVYNIEEMTPHRMLLAWSNYLASLLFQLPADKIVFQTADKNSALSTTISDVTIAERQSETVSALGPPLFYPIYGEFKLPVTIRFARIMANLGKGYIRGTFYGQPLYFLPIGKLDAKPATNQAQEWKLLLAPKNTLETIKSLSLDGVFTTNSMGNQIFTSILNPLHFNKYNYQLPVGVHHKDIYDDQFQNRGNTYIAPGQYAQPWQKADPIYVQHIVSGFSGLTITVYDSKAVLYFTSAMNVIADPAVQLPYIRYDYTLDPSDWPEDRYLVIISSEETKLRISEWIDLREDWPGTLLFRYFHTTNKFNTYFTGFAPVIRIDASLLDWYDDDSHENYTDEFGDNELIDGIPVPKRMIETRFVPDWVRRKLNYILLLNRCYIEEERYSRTPEGKIEKRTVKGSNLASYKFEISNAINNNGLGTDETGSTSELVVTYTLDAQVFGSGNPGDVVNIEVTND